MITAIPECYITELLVKQLQGMFGLNTHEINLLKNIWEEVKIRLDDCFSPNPNKYYHKNDEVYFNPYHSGQYSIFFIYYLKPDI